MPTHYQISFWRLEPLAFFHQRSLEDYGKETPVLIIGDLNDEPCDRSLIDFDNFLNQSRFCQIRWRYRGSQSL